MGVSAIWVSNSVVQPTALLVSCGMMIRNSWSYNTVVSLFFLRFIRMAFGISNMELRLLFRE